MFAIVLLVLGIGEASPATAAETPRPGYQVFGRFGPTELHPGGEGALYLYVYDTGAAQSAGEPLTVTDTLPEGLEVVEVVSPAGQIHLSAECSGSAGRLVSCTLPSPSVGGEPTVLKIPLSVAADVEALNPSPPAPDVVEWSGGEALERGGRTTVPVLFGAGEPAPGFAKIDGWLSTAEGTTDTQAGSHPYEFTYVFSTNSRRVGSGQEAPIGEPRVLHLEVPAGIVGSALGAPTCPTALVIAELCPPDTWIGEVFTGVSGPSLNVEPMYNVTPPPGVAAEWVFMFTGIATYIDSQVRTGSDDGITQTIQIPERKVVFNTATVWGVPAELNHSGEPLKALLTNPTACGGPLTVTSSVTGLWEDPAINYPAFPYETHNALGEPIGFSGCNRLAFDPSIEGRPTTDVADSPTGYDFDLHVPQEEDPEGLATSELKAATVTLPEGLVVDPSSANGLQACSEAQIGFKPGTSDPYEFTAAAPSCPEASKIGTIEVDTPTEGHPLPGSVYLAAQTANPFGSLLALYLVVDDPITGIVIKLPALVQADPTTGRLTATVAESPQQPFTDFHFDFFEGPHASLKTPETCGSYETTSELVPWSGGASKAPSDPFQVTQAPGGGNCPTSEAAAPDHPSFSAGTLSTSAGVYSPLVFKVSREDGSQRLSRIDTTLPKGLLGKLAGIPYCPESAIAQAEHRSGLGEGILEQEHPSCPAASQVGTVEVGAGAGPSPVYVSGKAYLAGPYKGAPLSLVIITPSIAGPYDFGAVTVRSALDVDPITAQVTAVSDALPQILHGLPLDIRSVAVKMDRPDFTLNPTSCDPMSVTGSLTALTGQSAGVSSPFQVGECSRLGFAPKLKISLSGQTHRAGHPGLKAVLTYPSQGAYANIARAQVNLPHSEFLDQGNLNKVCKQAEISAGDCPAKSIYGRAKAWSPLLEKPLEGPIYLGVGFGYKLPALVAELDGQLRVLLVGKVDTGKNHGIRNTFEAVPDAPVSRFELTLKGGKKYGLLENSENICAKALKASAAFTAQNGAALTLHPTIAAQCGKKAKKHKGHKHHQASKK